ncbi:MAG: hypothetical protein ABI459_12075 [Deltaproteobacteria bacterium]
MTFASNPIVSVLRVTAMLALSLSTIMPAHGGPIIVQPTEPSTPIVYPHCPSSFTLTQKGSTIFRCKATVPSNEAHVPVFYAVNGSCAPTSYWNIGPQVATKVSGANTTVYFTCRHT